MSPLAILLIAFVCIFGGTLLGMFLHKRLPEYHLSADAKDVVRMATGLIVLIAALVLGLLIASAKSAFDAQNTQIKQMTAKIILLDVLLAKYGPDANMARDLLRRSTSVLADRIWRVKGFEHPEDAPFRISADPTDEFYDKLWELSPSNETQRAHKARAIKIIDDVTETRLVLFALRENSIPTPFLLLLVFWLTVIFASFSLFAQPSPVVIGCLFVCALSAAGAMYFVVDMSQPFSGLIQISSAPLRNALAPLGAPS